jgi:hypothetical protein
MNEANFFAHWLDHCQTSDLTRKEVLSMSPMDVTSKFNVPDLISTLYYGKDAVALAALSALREKFEWEMHHLESLNHPQETETCE